MKRFLALALSLCIVAIAIPSQKVYAVIDNLILKDPVSNTYIGRPEGRTLIFNLNFSDLTADRSDKEAVIRLGALNIIKAYDPYYAPTDVVSNQDAIALVLRMVGQELLAEQTAIAQIPMLPSGSPLRNLWSLGYLGLAQGLGLITPEQFADSMVLDQSLLDPSVNFMRERPVSRQQFADWVVRTMQLYNPTVFDLSRIQQSIYSFNDWSLIDADKINSVELLIANHVMLGGVNGNFDPRGVVNKADAARIIRNLDNLYLSMLGLEKKIGTVGALSDSQTNSTGSASVKRNFYIRTENGSVDLLQYSMSLNTTPQSVEMDTVVYKNGLVTGLSDLAEGDVIEYIVNPMSNTLLYVQVFDQQLVTETVQGYLNAIDLTKGTITLKDSTEKLFTFPMAKGLYGNEDNIDFLFVDGKKQKVSTLPIGSLVDLTLNNDIVGKVLYLGQPSLVSEFKGIVVENDPDLGFLTVIDNRGNYLTKYYYENDLMVKKKQYYEGDDEIGYLNQMFPNFRFNPFDSSIREIEPGDIVFFRVDDTDIDTITHISASTDYIAKYGKIKSFEPKGSVTTMLIEYENKQTAAFEIPTDLFISKAGKPIQAADVMVGDWAKILLNQAVIEPGYVLESVKELTIEGNGHTITNILKGQLNGINPMQNQLLLQNVETLGTYDWGNFKDVVKLSIAGNDIEYYYNDERISLDYALKHLKRSDSQVYVALENNFTGERVKKVSFRSNRDELLNADTVLSADGNGNFNIMSNDGRILTDDGTIVRRFGRLVDNYNINSADYAVVSLTGEKAAVVDIIEPPTNKVQIARGRVMSVDDGKSFKVQSMSLLTGVEYAYTPIKREFAIDRETKFYSGGNQVPIEEFLGYTENTVIDKVFNIVIQGTKATHISDTPYSTKAVRGEIYTLGDNQAGGGNDTGEVTIGIKNAVYYDNTTGKWLSVSKTNATLNIVIPVGAYIAKKHAVVNPSQLEIGQQLRILTDTLPEKIEPGNDITGNIVFVEK